VRFFTKTPVLLVLTQVLSLPRPKFDPKKVPVSPRNAHQIPLRTPSKTCPRPSGPPPDPVSEPETPSGTPSGHPETVVQTPPEALFYPRFSGAKNLHFRVHGTPQFAQCFRGKTFALFGLDFFHFSFPKRHLFDPKKCPFYDKTIIKPPKPWFSCPDPQTPVF